MVTAKQVQIHVGLLQRYCDKWKITLNTEKTETIVFARKTKNTRIIQPIKVYNNISQVKTIVKYLGVNLDSKRTYKIHIKTVLRKTYSVMKQLFPLMAKGSAVSSYNKLLIYKMILRPIITYAAPVWCGAANTNLKPLQNYETNAWD